MSSSSSYTNNFSTIVESSKPKGGVTLVKLKSERKTQSIPPVYGDTTTGGWMDGVVWWLDKGENVYRFLTGVVVEVEQHYYRIPTG